MIFSAAVFLAIATSLVSGQGAGTLTTETHPSLTIQQCTASKTCTTQQRSVVLDGNWRWLHSVNSSTNCYTGNTWDTTLCPNVDTCTANCALDGADYSGTYGITSSGNALTLKFVTHGPYSTNIGSRVYLLESETGYQMFNLLNQEFTFDVDMSQLPCGLNGAVYFVQMDKDGGMSRFSTNKAGAKFGTGYCDTQCPHDIKFINGKANIKTWVPSTNDTNAGTGYYGSCCQEMDIWEANSMAEAVTPHTCNGTGAQTQCEGTACGDSPANRYGGICDKDGCDFNSFRMGNQNFLGQGKTVNTNSKMTVVTQFITNNNSSSGTLTEIRRIYVQNGVTIQNSATNITGMPTGNSITDAWCNSQKTAFGDTNSFEQRGGLAQLGKVSRLVLVMSLWDDHFANMLWLDSSYPLTKDPSVAGVKRGNCSTSSGQPTDVEANSPNAQVTYSNIKYGPIGSTY
ncbi:cellobiohydrolaseI [Flagelloscypha sp. PMI_526]|nr:cellobiohydrolaseI [Flagelloscypha sp. PMI_526]